MPKPKTAVAKTFIAHLCNLSIDAELPYSRASRIIATIGPKTSSPEMVQKLMEAGMNVVRINASHGTHNDYKNMIKNVRDAEKSFAQKPRTRRPRAIALDLQGPELRTGVLEGGMAAKVKLEEKKKIRVTTDEQYAEKSTANNLFINYKNITKNIKEGNRIYIDYGAISLVVLKVEPTYITCEVETGGPLGSHKEVNLPGVDVDLPSLSKKDKQDIVFAIENDVDMIFVSFVRNAETIVEVKNILGKQGKDISVIAKIENHQGIDNFDNIVQVADGIMVARGDLGIELPIEKVFIAQKSMIAKCNKYGKPVICARQMLESMVSKPRPTRAESSDVANAILDGADCVMLSSETAQGIYPVECVQIMSYICREAEAAIWHKQLYADLISKVTPPIDPEHTLAISVVEASVKSTAEVIILSELGRCAHLIAKYRPTCPIIAVSRDLKEARKSNLYRGIAPLYYQEPAQENLNEENAARVKFAINYGLQKKYFTVEDYMIVVTEVNSLIGFAVKKVKHMEDDQIDELERAAAAA